MDLKVMTITAIVFLLAGAGFRRAATQHVGIAAFFVMVGFACAWSAVVEGTKCLSPPLSTGTGFVEYDGGVYKVLERGKKVVTIAPEKGGASISVPATRVRKIF